MCTDNGSIEIVPANPQVVYLPAYQPQVVYVQRAPRPGLFVSFGFGVSVGSWLHHDLDWHDHAVISWGRNHARPNDWWYRRPADRGHVTVVNNRVTVVNNHNERMASVWRPSDRGHAVNTSHSEPVRQSRSYERPAAVVTRPAPITHRESPAQVVRPAQPVRHEVAPVAARPVQTVRHDAPRAYTAPTANVTHSNGRVQNQVVNRAPALRPVVAKPVVGKQTVVSQGPSRDKRS